MFFKTENKEKIGNSVTDMELFSLRLSGMRISEEYRIEVNADTATVSYYTFTYGNGGEERLLKKQTVLQTQSVVDKLNSFDFVKWNGFSGKHPKGVTDGTMFNLSATLNGGKELRATGSQNFPPHFHDLEQWLFDTLRDCKEIG